MKNHKSYLVGTYNAGIKVIENGTLIYSAELEKSIRALNDAIYIPPPLNCYLLSSNGLQRKDIDDKPPYFFMDFKHHTVKQIRLRYSLAQQRLVGMEDSTKFSFSVINLTTKEVEFKVEKTVGGYIEDFKLFGDRDRRLVALARQRYIILFNLDFAQKEGSEITHYQIEKEEWRNEEVNSIAVCEKSDYVFVELGKGWMSSRILILKLNQNSLEQRGFIDHFSEKNYIVRLIDCFRYVGRHILWFGLPDSGASVVIYDFDMDTGEIQELKEKKTKLEVNSVIRFCPLENYFYYICMTGKLMRFKIRI